MSDNREIRSDNRGDYLRRQYDARSKIVNAADRTSTRDSNPLTPAIILNAGFTHAVGSIAQKHEEKSTPVKALNTPPIIVSQNYRNRLASVAARRGSLFIEGLEDRQDFY